MKRFNVDRPTLEGSRRGPEGFRFRRTALGQAIGAMHLAGSHYELPPGQHSCPYHWEAGREEWLFVLAGRPTVRTPEGEQQLGPDAIVCFPAGPEGAHQVTNRTTEDARFLIVSDRTTPNAVIYPDSDKVSVKVDRDVPGVLFPRETAVDYWDREG